MNISYKYYFTLQIYNKSLLCEATFNQLRLFGFLFIFKTFVMRAAI